MPRLLRGRVLEQAPGAKILWQVCALGCYRSLNFLPPWERAAGYSYSVLSCAILHFRTCWQVCDLGARVQQCAHALSCTMLCGQHARIDHVHECCTSQRCSKVVQTEQLRSRPHGNAARCSSRTLPYALYGQSSRPHSDAACCSSLPLSCAVLHNRRDASLTVT